MEVGDRIKKRRKELGLTLEQLGNQIGVSKGTVQRYEIGKIELKRESAIKLAGALKTTPAYLMGWEPEVIDFSTIHTIPIIEGIGIDEKGSIEAQQVGEDIAFNIKNPDEYRYFKIQGNDMSPFIQNGDYALIHLQQDIGNQDIAVVIINEYGGILRKICKTENIISLIALNPDYETIFLKEEESKYMIWGKLVEIKRKFN